MQSLTARGLPSAAPIAPSARLHVPVLASRGLGCQRVPLKVCRVATGSAGAAEGVKEDVPAVPVVPQLGGSDGNGVGKNNGGGGGGGGGGGNNGDGKEPMDPKIVALLAAAGRSVDSFPADFKYGLLANKVTPEILQRYFSFEANFIAKLVWGIDGFRERLLADPSFFVKLGIEIGIGVVMKITAEYTKRQENFAKEADFVFANTLMAIIADFMLTWLPAPTLSYRPRATASGNALVNFFASCPDNAFQKVPPGMEPFSLSQRLGAILRNGSKLLGVGFCASLIGVGVTNSLLFVRQQLDPTMAPPNAPQNVLATSAAYGVYMSVSSNLRYQIIAGIVEERGIEVLFKGNHQLCHLLSFVARTGNTFLGSLLWVDFVRLCGMQKASAKPAEAH
ncbi:hypothetical protein CHLRE_03g177350v5 [Chlamydomonas reinhardtii]|uniref:Uncharacterized protein n=1 Tax=Chlamydomonas reinhardtii TaxID=3055 RepID=A8IDT3_CHLRE|nr:uncharacterized protein CHLRE_03g177350v5 [Chlamydomonas reinhardtii]PNW85236.1 hypothetical protein CHLRE_03g177350v5 [Chlamydomonas reinhardtii]|eukprot:XP_001703430.1 hypothetical protein CHLREDRAFT_188153 [Chlamydomonas reinhardtii]